METTGLSNDEKARQELAELSARLDRDTEALSGGFEDFEDFQTVLQYGEQALPVLLEKLQREDDGEWWKMDAVRAIAKQYGQAIEGTDGVQLGHDEAKALIVDWGKDQGYISREDPPTEPEE